jgi:teichuronic acid biosynthesis glycosyltransferase TuaH
MCAVPQPLVVVFAGTSWDGVTGSDRLLAAALTPHADILWVDPPISAATPDRYRYGASRLGVAPQIRQVSDGVTRLTPRVLPLHTRPYIKVSTAALIRSQSRWALRKLDRRPVAVVACNLVDVLRSWGPGVSKVLYGTDDYVAGAELMGHDAARVAEDERRQLDNADLVVAVSTVLAERWTGLGAKRVVLIPNGVQTSAYHTPGEPAVLPKPLAGPVAGVIGQFSDRTDFELLAALADDGVSLLLVGPHDARWEPARFAALTGRPNVVWVGRQPFEALPSFLRHIDVGVTPYRDTPFNRASFPLKTLEYLAAGKPPVSTDLPAVHWLDSPLVRVASTPKAMVAAVRDAAAESHDPTQVAARQAFAEQHSWAERAKAFAAALPL